MATTITTATFRTTPASAAEPLPQETPFADRHIGPSEADRAEMLATLGFDSLESFTAAVVPEKIRLRTALDLPSPASESAALAELKSIASKNKLLPNLIGLGYQDCIVPPVIQRNILENPGWYTQYTPYQAEIAQGRLEALLNFQTLVADLCGLDLAGASLLDEPTAAAEAMAMAHRLRPNAKADLFFVASDCHPQTIAVVETRAIPMGIRIQIADPDDFDPGPDCFAALFQNPSTTGRLRDLTPLIEKTRAAGALSIVAVDLLSLVLVKSPGECGADIAVGSSQRFGVPMGYGGPHAAFLATRDAHKRQMPGRLVGVSKDAAGNPAYRLSLQTREQHIRRDKATSNICTAQVLLAVMASMYAVYHGPEGLRAIALRIHRNACRMAASLGSVGVEVLHDAYFDTLAIRVPAKQIGGIVSLANMLNLRRLGPDTFVIALDETTTDISTILDAFDFEHASGESPSPLSGGLSRSIPFLTHPVFNTHHTETEMLRYIRKLESRDLSLTTSMIPLGSCTMKLNATSQMFPVSWPEFSKLHPFAPAEQATGYAELFRLLETWLAEITGFDAVSLQPNAGSQGEYAGLLAIRGWHLSNGDTGRDICLIPTSAHGTNPASASMAGFEVVTVACDAAGNIDMSDLEAKATKHAERLGAVMVTYPSTHGVFEESITDICHLIHRLGGQVYLDGANMNAQVGLCRPGDIGADVCHLNLHKTFCIPHGGGGPGMGPICVAEHLAPHLPGHPLADLGDTNVGAVSGAPWGSASILVIPWMYIRTMGAEGLKLATETAILNANYIARRLSDHYPVLYRGTSGLVAHECIIDLRGFKQQAGIEVEDVAKRLMDYGFHSPTMSWPVPGTLMIEPTESESKAELDRFCDAMITIRAEIDAVAAGTADRSNNVLKHAPHTATSVCANVWDHPYSREEAAYPAPWTREHKFWPAVSRIDNVYGDRNLFCSCLPVEEE